MGISGSRHNHKEEAPIAQHHKPNSSRSAVAYNSIINANHALIQGIDLAGFRGNFWGQQQTMSQNQAEVPIQNLRVVKNDVNLQKKTLRLESDDSNENLSYLDFKFDAASDCIVTIYFCAKETKNALNYPLLFYTSPMHGAPKSYKFTAGNNQQFPNKAAAVDLSVYTKEELQFQENSYYPLVIFMEAVNTQQIAKKRKCQITYGAFTFGRTQGEMGIQVLKQKLIYGNEILDLHHIYGVSQSIEIDNPTGLNSASNQSEEEGPKTCIICFTNLSDTVVLPCHHMCLCGPCAQITKMHSSKCPLCRTTISTIVKINVPNRNRPQIPPVIQGEGVDI